MQSSQPPKKPPEGVAALRRLIFSHISKMVHDLRALQFCQIGWNELFNFSPNGRIEFIEELGFDRFAGGQETSFDLLVARQAVESSSHPAYHSFAQLQFQIMPFTIRHRAAM